jgi:hypothetical protein
MTERLVMGKIVDGKFVPIGTSRCAMDSCRNVSAGIFSWPDENTKVRLCERHARLLMARADFIDKVING